MNNLDKINNIYLNSLRDIDTIYTKLHYFTTQDIDTCIIQIEQKLQIENPKNCKKITKNLIEILQNILLHSEKSLPQYIIVGNNSIISGNVVEIQTSKTISDKLNHLLKLDANQLKSHYLQTLDNKQRSKFGGAGLGLITLVRSCKIDYDILDLDTNYSLFQLTTNF